MNECELSERLKEERVRLGLNQTEFANAGGVQKTSQINYESGKRSPIDLQYFHGIEAAGADIFYIIKGVRAGESVLKSGYSPEEQWLVSVWRELGEDDRSLVKALAMAIYESALKRNNTK